jgi:hypothetical protein
VCLLANLQHACCLALLQYVSCIIPCNTKPCGLRTPLWKACNLCPSCVVCSHHACCLPDTKTVCVSSSPVPSAGRCTSCAKWPCSQIFRFNKLTIQSASLRRKIWTIISGFKMPKKVAGQKSFLNSYFVKFGCFLSEIWVLVKVSSQCGARRREMDRQTQRAADFWEQNRQLLYSGSTVLAVVAPSTMPLFPMVSMSSLLVLWFALLKWTFSVRVRGFVDGLRALC